jgi:hypothetical protein
VWIGTNLATRMPERGLRPALGIVLLASGLGLLGKAGVDMPAGVLAGVPIVLVAVVVVVLRRRPRRSSSPVADAST